MGNCIKERKPTLTQFDLQEISKLNQIFDHYCDLYPDTRKRRQLSIINFEEIFVENPEFGRKLFHMLEIYGKKEKYICREVLFSVLEVFLKDACTAAELKNFEKFELMSLVSLKQSQFALEKEELHKLKITYLDAITILNDLLHIRLSGDNFQNIDERSSRALLDQIFRRESGLIEWFELMKALKHRLKGSVFAIKSYFQRKFMGKTMPVLSPQLSHQSYLLNEDWLFQLQMAAFNTYLKGSIKLELIYSNIVHHGGFNQLTESLLNCSMPTIMVFQHEEQYVALQDKSLITKSNVFGAISNQRWFDTAQAQGDNNDCLFQLCPNFIVFNPKKEKTAKKNYCYLNTTDKTKPIGLGFGYDEGKCRIWIDKDMINKSYVNKEDSSYESGDMVSKHIKKLQLSIIEVWGMVHASNEENYDEDEVGANEQTNLIEDLDGLDSKADFYWVNQKKEQQTEQVPDFYWANGNTNQRKESQQTTYARNLNTDTQIAKRLVGEEVENEKVQITNQQFEESKVSIRRSNMQRPQLDWKKDSNVNDNARVRSTYNPTTEPLYKSTSPIEGKHEIFGTTLEKTVTVTSTRNPEKGRKTVDEVIRDYETRKQSTQKKKY